MPEHAIAAHPDLLAVVENLACGDVMTAEALCAELSMTEAPDAVITSAQIDLCLAKGDLDGALQLLPRTRSASPRTGRLALHAAEIAHLRSVSARDTSTPADGRSQLRALAGAIANADAKAATIHAAAITRCSNPAEAGLAARHEGLFLGTAAGLALIEAARGLWPVAEGKPLLLSELALLEAAAASTPDPAITQAAAACERRFFALCAAHPRDDRLVARWIDARVLAGQQAEAVALAKAAIARFGATPPLQHSLDQAMTQPAAPPCPADESPTEKPVVASSGQSAQDWWQRCDAAIEAGQLAHALAIAEAWQAEMPNHPVPPEFRLRLLRLTGNRKALAQALHEDGGTAARSAPFHVEAARGHRFLAQPIPASERLARALALAPSNARAALDRATVLEGCGMTAGARQVLTECLAAAETAGNPDGPAPLFDEMRLELARLAQTAGDIPAAQAALAPLLADPSTCRDAELLRLFLAAEGLGDDIAMPVLEALLDRPLAPETGAGLLRHVLSRSDVGFVRRLAARLIAAHPPDQQGTVAPHLLLVAEGASAALAALRAARPQPDPRDADAMARLATLLEQAGRPGTARRVLKRALIHNPTGARLRTGLVGLQIGAGRLDQAEAAIHAAARAGLSDEWCRAQRVRVLEAAGRLDDAIAELERLPWRNDTHLLQLAVWAGDLPRAEDAMRRMGLAIGQQRARARRSSETLEGAALNELRVLAELRARGEVCAVTEGSFHLPAMQRITAWHRARNEAQGEAQPVMQGAAIPAIITQYWDRTELPPEIAALVATWQSMPGFSHRLLDHAGAEALIIRHFGTRHLRAFRLANHVVEEADYIRLCALVAEGGIYADADDRRLRRLDRLLGAARGALLVREPSGAIANNFIAAPPNHPVMVHALEDVTRALLARDNSAAWFKTGPGPLTRALAWHLADAPAQGHPVEVTLYDTARVAPFIAFHRPVAYKSSAAYWNAAARAYSPAMRAAIEARLTGLPEAESPETEAPGTQMPMNAVPQEHALPHPFLAQA